VDPASALLPEAATGKVLVLVLAPVTRNQPRPLYAQLADNIERAIADGQLACGDRLPSELKIAADLKVTQSTVRRAWAFLWRKGIVRRESGVGTFVA
jgi:DNA-binding GntR family transcriptional regulator